MAATVAALATKAPSQVVRDGSLGRGPRTLAGPDITVSPRHGKQVGGNLFHSFRQFDLARGNTATFTGPDNIRNVLARVTGGTSRIDGRVACSIPDANLFLMNPSGVIFGPNARLDISGSVAVLSADSIQFPNGGVFPGNPNQPAVLSSSSPTAFGFLGPKAAGIQVNGARLEVRRGRELALIGSGRQPRGEAPGGIVIRDTGTPRARSGKPIGALLRAEDGRIDLLSANGSGSIVRRIGSTSSGREKTEAYAVDQLSGFGDISLSARSVISVSGAAAGFVFVRGAVLNVRDSVITAVTTGDGRSAGVDVGLSEACRISGSFLPDGANEGGIGVFTDATNSGAAGNIRVDAPLISIDPRPRTGPNGVQLEDIDGLSTRSTALFSNDPSDTRTAGAAGDIEIFCDQLILRRNAAVRAETLGKSGDGGEIRITARDLIDIDGTDGTYLTGISTRTFPTFNPEFVQGSRGNPNPDNFGTGGDISITSGGTIRLANGGRIIAETGQFKLPRHGGSASGGNIRIEAADVRLEGFKAADPDTPSSIRTLAYVNTSGNAGDVAIYADSVRVTDGASIQADTRGPGAAGLITLDAQTILVSGVNSRRSGSATASRITSVTTFPGNDGGRGGSIIIEAGTLRVADGGRLAVGTGVGSTGSSGRIRIGGDRAEIVNGGAIDSSTGASSQGNGGEIRFGATFRPLDTLVVDSGTVAAVAGPGSTGQAGRITGAVGVLQVRNGGRIQTESLSVGSMGQSMTAARGRAGDILFDAVSHIQLDPTSSIVSSAARADGGNIRLRVANTGSVVIAGTVTTKSLAGANTGGDILIDGGRFIHLLNMQPGARGPTAESAQRDTYTGTQLSARSTGDGGNITLQATDRIVLRRSLVSGNSGRFGGNITIDPSVVTLDRAIIDGRSADTPVPVNIDTRALLLSPDSLILTDAPAFTVNNDLAGSITPMRAEVSDPFSRLLDRCAIRLEGLVDEPADRAFSSFVVLGRGRSPSAPGQPLFPELEESPATEGGPPR